MNRNVRISRRGFASGLAVLSFFAISWRVQAGVLGGFATEWTQLANNLQLVHSYIRLGDQLQQEIRMVLDMTKNSQILPSQLFGPISTDIARLASVVQGGQA